MQLRSICCCAGHAFDAASKLCDQVLEKFPCGTILVSDAVMQAVGRTHHLEFSGAGYQLLGRCASQQWHHDCRQWSMSQCSLGCGVFCMICCASDRQGIIADWC